MKSYRLNIGVTISVVGICSLVFISASLFIFKMISTSSAINLLLNYAYIIAPTSMLWVAFDKYLWHTRLFQLIKKTANIPPDIRGRWEGTLENEDGSEIQKFVIEVKQTLTSLSVNSYSSLGKSVSILPEIACSENEENFTLCYLWKGTTNTSIKEILHRENFFGYTMLNLDKTDKPSKLNGGYFANRQSGQSRGGIQLTWVSHKLKLRLE